MTTMTGVIVFEHAGDLYSIPEAEFPIVLPNGDVLSGEKWGETCPEKPLGLKKIFELRMTPDTDLAMVAKGLDGVLAVLVVLETYFVCPKGCFSPTVPFCMVCGSLVEKVTAYVPAKAKKSFTPHVIDGVVPVKGNGPCPNCKQELDHNAHAAHCPNCGQALHWTCR
jgi:hypothetical protein